MPDRNSLYHVNSDVTFTHGKLGEAARLKPLEVELKRLEDLSEAIVQDFAYMRQREEEMRDTNGNKGKNSTVNRH